jgi:hypothetical protein
MLKSLTFLSGLALCVALGTYEVPAQAAALTGNVFNYNTLNKLTGSALTGNAHSTGTGFVVACNVRLGDCL